MATPVGALACQRDTFLRKITTKVISTVASATAAASNAKKGSASSLLKKLQVEIILQDTVLFPEGGGQPCDFGTLLNKSNNVSTKIINVQRRGNTCVHFAEADSEQEQEKLIKETLKEGQEVDVELDWDRRLDHAQHHTAQHLLTAVVEQITGLPTDSWALSHPTCNILLGRKEITADEVDKIEQRCNELIQQTNTPVKCLTFPTREDVPPARSRSIPQDVTGPIRMIEIPEVDACTCCGTHLNNLGQLGMLKVLHQEPKGNTVRLHFVVGERVRKMFGEMYSRERALMKDYGRTPDQLVECSDARGKQLSASLKTEKKLRAELTTFLAPTVVSAASTTQPANAVYVHHREDADSEMLLAFCEALTKSGVTASRVCVVAGGLLKGDGSFMITGPDEGSVKTFAEKVFLPAVGNGTKGNYVKGVFRGKFTAIASGWKDFVKSRPVWPNNNGDGSDQAATSTTTGAGAASS